MPEPSRVRIDRRRDHLVDLARDRELIAAILTAGMLPKIPIARCALGQLTEATRLCDAPSPMQSGFTNPSGRI
jgi:hypothetical protein